MLFIYQNAIWKYVFFLLIILAVKLLAALIFFIYDKIKDNRLDVMNEIWEIERALAKKKISYENARKQQDRAFSRIKERKYRSKKHISFKNSI